MGKRKIEIERIEDEQKRQVAFSKRRKGIFSKATQLCNMDLSTQMAIVAFSPAGKPYTFSHSISIDSAIHRFLHFTSTSNYYPTSQTTSTHQQKRQHKGIREVLDQDTERLKSWDEAMSLEKGILELKGKILKRIQQLSSSPSSVVLDASMTPFITTGFSTACVSEDIHHDPSSCSWEALISDELAAVLEKNKPPNSFTSMMMSLIFDGDDNIASNDPQITCYTEDDQDPSRSIDHVAAPVADLIEDPTVLATASSNAAANNFDQSPTTLLATTNNSESHFTSTIFAEKLVADDLIEDPTVLATTCSNAAANNSDQSLATLLATESHFTSTIFAEELAADLIEDPTILAITCSNAAADNSDQSPTKLLATANDTESHFTSTIFAEELVVADLIDDPTLATTCSYAATNNLDQSPTTLLATANNSQRQFTSTIFAEELAADDLIGDPTVLATTCSNAAANNSDQSLITLLATANNSQSHFTSTILAEELAADLIEDPTVFATTCFNAAANNSDQSPTKILAIANHSESHFTPTTFAEELAAELLSSNNIGMEDDIYIFMHEGELYWR